MTDEDIYEYLGRSFEWDRKKAALNVFRHGVRFTEAATVFEDANALVEHDPDHSEDEERWLVLGRSAVSNLLVVVHLYRAERTRIISARRPTRSERRTYEARLGG